MKPVTYTTNTSRAELCVLYCHNVKTRRLNDMCHWWIHCSVHCNCFHDNYVIIAML